MSAAAAAAEAYRRMLQEEEEEVTPMSADPAAGFEYKIVRGATAVFKSPAKLKEVLEEEARAGWELFEKLDDRRVRLRRPVSCRERDAALDQDPYRSTVGMSEGAYTGWIVAATLGGTLALLALVLFLTGLSR